MRLSAVAADASRRKSLRAFTVAELMVVVAVVAVLCALFIVPTLLPHKMRLAQRASCQNNLKQIGLAFRVWESDNGNLFPARYFTNPDGTTKFTSALQSFLVMSNELNNPRILFCPVDTERTSATNWGSNFSNLNTSYLVGLYADDTFPAMILSGDRNLVTNGVDTQPGVVTIRATDKLTWSKKLHNKVGNIGLADGSVQQSSSASLPGLVSKTGVATNRLAIP